MTPHNLKAIHREALCTVLYFLPSSPIKRAHLKDKNIPSVLPHNIPIIVLGQSDRIIKIKSSKKQCRAHIQPFLEIHFHHCFLPPWHCVLSWVFYEWQQKERLRHLDDTCRVIIVQLIFEIIQKAFSVFRSILEASFT